ncbi:transcription factor IIIA-like isoform X1 [Varroa destructor]|uniref:C2H2-type domain-containing protein n=1 Tax=Varroa destructor TaxID=109461 RepID=A0A7M7JQV8_VARDE|nr:transcription factor IIIA-like isoform X1 [Varroa destructor]XP_022649794.1 transcription factor IIIA-like isoform X1 [Varroa destructor]XP_022649796.1 transcription factor IIIA-like isoform X1 [Varroa destructor]
MEADILTRISLETVLGKPNELPTKARVIRHEGEKQWQYESCSTEDNINNKDISEKDKNWTTSSNKPKRFVCDVPGCNKAFVKPIFLEMHVRTHTDERPYLCTVEGCSQAYTRSWHLKRHVERAHKETRDAGQEQSLQRELICFWRIYRHLCTWQSCSKEYNSRDALKKHIARVHEGRENVGRQRPGERLACTYCAASFAKHSRLKAHLYHHTGEMPFKCRHEECGKQFIMQSKLKAHEKTHAGYECEKCPGHSLFFRFPTWSALRKHFKEKHNVKRCSKCDKTFTRSVNLEAHLATHENEREAYLCSHEGCTKSYFDLKNLRTHLKAAHEGVRFTCSVCEKKFRSKQAVRRHAKKCSLKIEKRAVRTGADRKPRKDKGVVRKRAATWLSGWEEIGESSERSGCETTEDADVTVNPDARGALLALIDKISRVNDHAVYSLNQERDQKSVSVQETLKEDHQRTSECDDDVRDRTECHGDYNDNGADQEEQTLLFTEQFDDLEQNAYKVESGKSAEEMDKEKDAFTGISDRRSDTHASHGELGRVKISDSKD